jgi:hypothetical protein
LYAVRWSLPRTTRPVEVAVLARHAVQRLDRARHGEEGEQLVVGVDEQLGPRAVHGERLDGAAVRRQAAGVVDDVAVAQLVHRAAVRRAVERDRELQLVGAHAQRRAGERDPLRVAGELELGLGGAQRREVDVAVAEDEHPPALDAAVHAAGHLEDLVAPEVRAGEHVAPALDHVGEARVVDDHGVEPAHVERALPGRVMASTYGCCPSPSRNGRMTRIGSPPW